MSCSSTLSTGIAVGPKWIIQPREQIEALEKLDKVPFDFTLKKLGRVKGRISYNDNFSHVKVIWPDFQPNDKGWMLCSERLKVLIDAHLKGGESFKWISCDIIYGEERRLYYIPLFMKETDVLNLEKSLYYEAGNERFLIKPVFSQAKVQAYNIFSVPIDSYPFWRLKYSAYVREELKKAICDAGMIGMVFERVAVSD